MGLNVVAASAQHVGSRKNQQDAFGSCELAGGELIAVLADGMGGLEHGEAASRIAVQTALQVCQAAAPSTGISDLFLHAVYAANEAVKRVSQELGSAGNVGTTIVLACVKDADLWWVAVGDSGLFLHREGALTQLNTAHIYGNRLSREESATHPDRESLTSYLGIENLTEVDRNVQPFKLQSGDRLMLMSDGIFKVLQAGEMSELIHGNAQQISDELLQRTLAKRMQYQDNATIVTLALGEQPVVAAIEPQKRAGVSLFAAAIVLLAIGSGIVWRYLGHPPVNVEVGPQVLMNLPRNPAEKPATTAAPTPGVPPQNLTAGEEAAKAEHAVGEESQ